MEDPNIVATLVAMNTRAERAFQLDENWHRYQPPLLDHRPLPSRENTPFPDEIEEQHADVSHRLKLSFDKPPKDLRQGFVFGSDPDCDIRLVDRTNFQPQDRDKVQYISRKHFSVTFDEQRRVILRDTSTLGTSVSYDGQAEDEIRSHFTWIIFPGFETVKVKIPAADISFAIQLGEHEHCEAQYFAKIDLLFPQRTRAAESGLTSRMQKVKVQSQSTSVAPSGAQTPRRGPIYLLQEELGQGGFGKVYKVVDVSSGESYAGKAFFGPEWTREVAIMKKVEHVGCR